MIKLENISKSFGDTEVIKDITTVFDAGQVNLIIGQSGHGKSVLAKCIVGLFESTEGSIFYDDRDFYALKRKEQKKLRQEIGMLFQGSALFDSLTVLENVMFPLKMFSNMKKKEMIERAHFCLERTDITDIDDLYPSEISGGMKKRVAIARSIVMKPKYLFCDEPNSGLDPKTSILIDNLIREITYELNMTTVVITHDMNSVIEIGDKIMFIYQGKNWWEGTKKEILKTDNPEVISFVYASEFMQDVKEKLTS